MKYTSSGISTAPPSGSPRTPAPWTPAPWTPRLDHGAEQPLEALPPLLERPLGDEAIDPSVTEGSHVIRHHLPGDEGAAFFLVPELEPVADDMARGIRHEDAGDARNIAEQVLEEIVGRESARELGARVLEGLARPAAAHLADVGLKALDAQLDVAILGVGV